jgi:hypothetical protein
MWTRIDFGLKPVFMITDVYTYRSEFDGIPQVLVLSKQVYANHYFDGSLSLTAAIANQTRTKSDLLYVNLTRAGVLASSFSKFKHQIVEGRATEYLKNLLGQTRINLDALVDNSSPSSSPTWAQRISESSVLRTLSWLLLLILIGKAFTVRRKVRRLRTPASSGPPEKSRLSI